LNRVDLGAVPRQSRSLRQQVAETLRRAIVYGELEPGQRLVEEDLAERLDMSRGPIREALRQLEQEGLVASFPYRGTVVAETSTDEVVQVLVPIRAALEQFALDHALPRLTAEDFTRLSAIVESMAVAAAEGDLPEVVELDMRFHRLVVERSNQFHSLQLWDLVAPRIRGLFYRMGPHHHSLSSISEQHRLLLGDLRSGDPNRAADALREHIAEPKLYAQLQRPAP
jgi:DNA-binding GntR family transcriptional regulator